MSQKQQIIKKEFILNNLNNSKDPYLFRLSYGGLKLFCKLSKNQKRKLSRYGFIPTQPKEQNLIMSNKRIKIQKYISSKYHKQTREKRAKTFISINKNLIKCNNLTFIKNSSKDKTNQEIGTLFKIALLNNHFCSGLLCDNHLKIRHKNKRTGGWF